MSVGSSVWTELCFSAPPPTKRHRLRLLRHGIWTVMGTCVLLFVCTTCASQLSTDSLWSNFCFCIANVSVLNISLFNDIFLFVSPWSWVILILVLCHCLYFFWGNSLCPLSLSLTDCLFLLVDLKGLFYIKGIRSWYVHSFLVRSFKLFMVFSSSPCLSFCFLGSIFGRVEFIKISYFSWQEKLYMFIIHIVI